MMKKAAIIILSILSIYVWLSCNSHKINNSKQAYNFLNKEAKIQFEESDKFYDSFEKEYQKIVNSTISGLDSDGLIKLFDMFMENRNGIGSPVALDAIVFQFGEINTQESADNLLSTYLKHRKHFQGQWAIGLNCTFKKLDKLTLTALSKIEIENDRFLMRVNDMIINNKPCV